jgi:hypothetical protein
MADSDSNDDLKKKAERAKDEATLLRAEADRIKAQAELAAAGQPPDPALAERAAEKARLDAQKSVLDARKALFDAKKAADLSDAQAAIGTVTGSNFDGTVTLKSDAGKGEATLLAARAMAIAADAIVGAIKTKVSGKRIVLLASADALPLANYRQFLLQETFVSSLLDQAMKTAVAAADAASHKPGESTETVAAQIVAAPALTTAGAVIDAVARLGSYLAANYEMGGIALTADGAQLASAVADRLLRSAEAKVLLPGRRVPDAAEFTATMGKLAQKVAAASLLAAKLDNQVKQLPANDPLTTGLQAAAASLRAAIGKVQDFVTALGALDANGIMLLSKVVQEKSVGAALAADGTLALILEVRAAVGGYYTKKSLWTFLTTKPPFYAMGGAVVTYTLVDKDGEIKASGLLPIHGGYASVAKVAALIGALDSTAR